MNEERMTVDLEEMHRTKNDCFVMANQIINLRKELNCTRASLNDMEEAFIMKLIEARRKMDVMDATAGSMAIAVKNFIDHFVEALSNLERQVNGSRVERQIHSPGGSSS